MTWIVTETTVLGLLENIYLTVISSVPYCIEVEHTIFAIAAMFV